MKKCFLLIFSLSLIIYRSYFVLPVISFPAWGVFLIVPHREAVPSPPSLLSHSEISSGFQMQWSEYTTFEVSVHEGFVSSMRYNPNFYNPHLLHNYAMICIFLHPGWSVLSGTSLQCEAPFFWETSQCKWWNIYIRRFFTKMEFKATSFRKKNLKLGFKNPT